MKKMNFKFFNAAMLLMAVALFSVSCKNDEPTKKEKAMTKQIYQKDVQNYTKWYYFSFAEDKFVGDGEADPTNDDDAKWAKRTDWDIAFHANNVRTNSGTSGMGKGGIMVLETEDFESVKEFTGNDFKVDIRDANNQILINNKHVIGKNVSLNPVADSWIYFQHQPSFKWIMAKKNVFIVRTADGKKYAKIQFVNFFDDKGTSKFLTMKYAYQKDGSTKFE